MTDYKKRLYPRKSCDSHHTAGGGRFSGFDREPGTAQARFLGFLGAASRGDHVYLTWTGTRGWVGGESRLGRLCLVHRKRK